MRSAVLNNNQACTRPNNCAKINNQVRMRTEHLKEKSLQVKLAVGGMAFLMLVLAMEAAHANSNVALTYSSGADDYDAYGVNANIDIFTLPLQANVDYFTSSLNNANTTKETGIGLTWRPVTWASSNYRHSKINDDTFDVQGDEIGAGMNFNHFWKSDLITRLDIGFGAFDYTANARPVVQAVISNLVPDQRRYHVGISQDITQDVTIYGSHETYQYSKDPVFLARFLIRRTGFVSQGPSALLSFPDKNNTIGMEWRSTEKATFNLSYSRTDTVINQKQESGKLGVNYQINAPLSANFSVSRARSDAVRNLAGVIVLPSSMGTTVELSMGYAFK